MADRLRSPPSAAVPPAAPADPVRPAAGAVTSGPASLPRPGPLFRAPVVTEPPVPVTVPAPAPSAGAGKYRFQPVRPPAPLFPAVGGGGGSAGYNVAAQVRSMMAPDSRQNRAAPPPDDSYRQSRGRSARGRGEQSPARWCVLLCAHYDGLIIDRLILSQYFLVIYQHYSRLDFDAFVPIISRTNLARNPTR